MWGNLSPLPQGRGGFWAQSSCSSGGLRLGITGGFALSPPAGYKPTSVDRTLAPPPASASRGRRRQLFVLLGPLASFLGQSRALPLPAGTGLPVPRLPPRLPLPLAFELIPPRGAQAGGCPLGGLPTGAAPAQSHGGAAVQEPWGRSRPCHRHAPAVSSGG